MIDSMNKMDIYEAMQSNLTDKQGFHNYGIIYELLFSALYSKLGRRLKILEIGVLGGDSIEMFANLYCVDTVVGIDNVISDISLSKVNQLPNAQIHYTPNAYEKEAIDFIGCLYGTFDCIIDDGCHQIQNQKFFLENYGVLINSGVLVCEDVLRDFPFDDLGNMDFVINVGHEDSSLILRYI